MILIDREKGVLSAGSEHHKDGCSPIFAASFVLSLTWIKALWSGAG